MVELYLNSLEIEPNVKHIATDWQISDTLNFKNIIAESIADTANLNSIMFNMVLEPGKKYYGRARALLDKNGYTVWGNLDVFTPKVYDDFDNTSDLPTPVATPIITTSSSVNYHIPTLFKIYAKGFSVIGNARHVATSWYIEDLDGNNIWSKVYDTIHKTEILASDAFLEDNTVYRIKAMFHSSSNDTSALGAKTIKTALAISNPTNNYFLNQLRRMDFGTDTEVIFPRIVGATSYEVSLSEVNHDTTQEIANYPRVNKDCTIKIDANTIRDNRAYIIIITPNVGEPVTYYFYTYKP